MIRKLMLITATMGLLGGCASVGAAVQTKFQDSIFGTQAQRDLADSAQCQSYGAQPGTDVFVTCMVQMAQIRATRQAASKIASQAFLANAQAQANSQAEANAAFIANANAQAQAQQQANQAAVATANAANIYNRR